ncbi:hypothetical protein [Rhodalgimonas zhirmunskyi]|uniref:Rap1a immunity protein domain-containing protein n=1 Tax=Rhodalgimonas zhirmunskyi TaxID=2964767 RepID=A0AAJ1X5W2_9RHOB|nr:hypothetical protein [Rhodoalgimonas zhirmunskyi]MDQ2094044.1 hypothetical protein [Rhodoalgimonas zhirmunskyi]
MMRRAFSTGATLLLGHVLAQAVHAQDVGAPDGWSIEKCDRYKAAWAHMQPETRPGIGAGFLRDHAAFLASGCLSGRVCPQSPAEIELADTLSLMAVADGMAGSFTPFSCD